jgi:hypothetical protein
MDKNKLMKPANIPDKYELSWFEIPSSVSKEASKYLEQRKELPKSKRGAFTPQQAGEYNAEQKKEGKKTSLGSGHARAITLSSEKYISPKTIRRMKAFFDRHSFYKKEGYHTYTKGKDMEGKEIQIPSKSLQSWWSWGGDAGYSWAKSVVEKMNNADAKKNDKKTISEHGDSLVESYMNGNIPHYKEIEDLFNKIQKIQ